MDWIRARVIECGCGLVSEEILFDERAQDFTKLIEKGITQGLKYCVCLSLASAARTQGNGSADDTVHRVTCRLALFRSPLAKRSIAELAWLAETLYMAFCGAFYQPTPGSGKPDVFADSFSPTINPQGVASFEFDVSVELDLDKLNYNPR